MLGAFICACKIDNTKSVRVAAKHVFAEFSFCFLFCLLSHCVPYTINVFLFLPQCWTPICQQLHTKLCENKGLFASVNWTLGNFYESWVKLRCLWRRQQNCRIWWSQDLPPYVCSESRYFLSAEIICELSTVFSHCSFVWVLCSSLFFFFFFPPLADLTVWKLPKLQKFCFSWLNIDSHWLQCNSDHIWIFPSL